MEVISDFSELFGLLNERGVEYVIVGGYATAFHGAPRFTGDLDLYVNPTATNAERIISALIEFGFGSLEIKPSDFTEPDHVIQLGMPPVRVDLLTSITGVSWEAAVSGSADGKYGNHTVRFLGREELILNKRAVGRAQDLADIEALGEQAK